MKNVETELQFLINTRDYIIELIEKDFKDNKKFCAFTKQKIIKQISWVYNQEVDYIERNHEDYLDRLDSEHEDN